MSKNTNEGYFKLALNISNVSSTVVASTNGAHRRTNQRNGKVKCYMVEIIFQTERILDARHDVFQHKLSHMPRREMFAEKRSAVDGQQISLPHRSYSIIDLSSDRVPVRAMQEQRQ
jgi:hypothetical protein